MLAGIKRFSRDETEVRLCRCCTIQCQCLVPLNCLLCSPAQPLFSLASKCQALLCTAAGVSFLHLALYGTRTTVTVFCLSPGLAGQVNIDANGDRIADYSLLDMDPATSTFHVSAVSATASFCCLCYRLTEVPFDIMGFSY
jgi:hypothetical protein